MCSSSVFTGFLIWDNSTANDNEAAKAPSCLREINIGSHKAAPSYFGVIPAFKILSFLSFILWVFANTKSAFLKKLCIFFNFLFSFWSSSLRLQFFNISLHILLRHRRRKSFVFCHYLMKTLKINIWLISFKQNFVKKRRRRGRSAISLLFILWL